MGQGELPAGCSGLGGEFSVEEVYLGLRPMEEEVGREE